MSIFFSIRVVDGKRVSPISGDKIHRVNSRSTGHEINDLLWTAEKEHIVIRNYDVARIAQEKMVEKHQDIKILTASSPLNDFRKMQMLKLSICFRTQENCNIRKFALKHFCGLCINRAIVMHDHARNESGLMHERANCPVGHPEADLVRQDVPFKIGIHRHGNGLDAARQKNRKKFVF